MIWQPHLIKIDVTGCVTLSGTMGLFGIAMLGGLNSIKNHTVAH